MNNPYERVMMADEWLTDRAERRFVLEVHVRERDIDNFRFLRGEYDTLADAVASAEPILAEAKPDKWGDFDYTRRSAWVWDRQKKGDIVWQGWPDEAWRRHRKVLQRFVRGIKFNEPGEL